MTDRRRYPANGRVAAACLEGRAAAERFVQGEVRQVILPVVDLLNAPGQRRERQMLMGQAATVFEDRDGWCFVQEEDGYVGYLPVTALGRAETMTHRVINRTTHLYPEADFKTRERAALSHGSLLVGIGEAGRFIETSQGFVPSAHVAPIAPPEADPVAVALSFLGTPYLWGGNSGFGLDCSGLVQAACRACGIACPGDSDMQEAELGEPLADDAPLRRGDLLFWKGHVAWVVDAGTILHANAHHMAVTQEGMSDALARIAGQGEGPVTARKRLEDFA